MKSKLSSSIALMFLLFFISCEQNDDTNTNVNTQSLDEISFNQDFDWNTAVNIAITVESESEQVLTVSSLDDVIRYYRCIHPGNGVQIDFKINIPKTVDYVKINGDTLSTGSGIISTNIN